MRRMHRLLIIILVLTLCLPASACFEKDDRYLEKTLLTLADMERLFKSEGFNLVRQGEDMAWQFTQRSITAAAFFIEGDPTHILTIYVFESTGQRERAAEDFNDATALMSMLYHELLGVKNVLVLMFARDPTCEYYAKLHAAMERARTA